MTGFPLRTGFGRGVPEHDPWRFEASRLVDSGEADCAVWISAYGARPPTWKRDVPLVVLTDSADALRTHVTIAVGRPGIDHDAVEYLAATGTLAAVSARHPHSRGIGGKRSRQDHHEATGGAPC